MRNILILPDGTQQDFMYPSNRKIRKGETLRVEMMDDVVHHIYIIHIEKKEDSILYYTSYEPPVGFSESKK